MLKDAAQSSNYQIIFSGDPEQWLRTQELNNNIKEEIMTYEHSYHTPILEKKIRCNKELNAFIKKLFDRKSRIPKNQSTNINIIYFDNFLDANIFIKNKIDDEHAKLLVYTPSTLDKLPYDAIYKSDCKEINSHNVIGQEFEHVITIMDENFIYNHEDKLIYNKSNLYYNPVKMLYQNLTRATDKITLVIIKNPELYIKIIDNMDGTVQRVFNSDDV